MRERRYFKTSEAQKHAFFRHKKTPIKGVCKFKWWCIPPNHSNFSNTIQHIEVIQRFLKFKTMVETTRNEIF